MHDARKLIQASLLFALPLFQGYGLAGEGVDDLGPYPEPQAGFERWVFRVPAVDDESDRKVEILVGKTMAVDCNPARFLGDLLQKTVAGWGYSYFEVADIRGPAATLMACPPGREKKDAFVKVQGDGFLQRYNSKLPVVVHVPVGYEVRYRIWSASPASARAHRE